MHLSERTWPEADAAETDLAVLPVGSTEQHGPHAPLGTDALAAEAVAEAGARAHEGEVVVAPPIPVGVAEEHRGFAGTLWVSEDTFRDYVRETVASLAHHGWDRVVVVNGHGGNTGPLREVCGRLTRDGTGNGDGDVYAVPFTWFEAVDPAATPGVPDGTEMGHGGAIETSLVWHLRPELIERGEFDRARAEGAERWGEWLSGTNLAYDTDEFSASGAVGDPGEASPEAGEWLLDRAGRALADLLGAVQARD